MKVIIAIALFIIVGGFNSAKKENMHMPGAYIMLSQSVYDGINDATYNNLKQLKIFNSDFMMYVNTNPVDSVSGFGIGSYIAGKGNVTENVIYNASDSSANSMPGSFHLLIEKTAKGYKQIIPEITGANGQKIKLVEEYESVGKATKSPLDGAWKEVIAYTVKGKDTITNNALQYKMYHAGYFMFGHTYTDDAKKLHTGIGYGTFDMNSKNKIIENVLVSSYYQIRGKSFDIDIEINGKDEYKQTITNTDGSRNVEIYKRLMK